MKRYGIADIDRNFIRDLLAGDLPYTFDFKEREVGAAFVERDAMMLQLYSDMQQYSSS